MEVLILDIFEFLKWDFKKVVVFRDFIYTSFALEIFLLCPVNRLCKHCMILMEPFYLWAFFSWIRLFQGGF